MILASYWLQKCLKEIKKPQFRAKIILAATKIMFKFSHYVDYLGEYLTDFNKRGLKWELMVPVTYLMYKIEKSVWYSPR